MPSPNCRSKQPASTDGGTFVLRIVSLQLLLAYCVVLLLLTVALFGGGGKWGADATNPTGQEKLDGYDDDDDANDGRISSDQSQSHPLLAVLLLLPCEILWDSTIRVALQALRNQPYHHPTPAAVGDGDQHPLYASALRNCYCYATNAITLTLVGSKGSSGGSHEVNQDRAVIWTRSVNVPGNFYDDNQHGDARKNQSSFTTKLTISAVFDGHGQAGHYVAEWVRHELIRRLQVGLLQIASQQYTTGMTNRSKPEQPRQSSSSSISNRKRLGEQLTALLQQTFVEVNADIPDALATTGGATASLVLQWGEQLVLFANAGDSQSFLIQVNTEQVEPTVDHHDHHHPPNPPPNHGTETITPATKLSIPIAIQSVKVIYQTRLDKPDHPEEYQRIQKIPGAQVTKATRYDDARIWYTNSRGQRSGVAMSRGFGDKNHIGVIAEPIVEAFHLPTPEVMTCDGESLRTDDDIKSTITAADGGECAASGSSWSTNTATSTTDSSGTTTMTKGVTKVHWFVVSATDGIMDSLSPMEIAEALAPALFLPPNMPPPPPAEQKQRMHPATVMEDLFYRSAAQWDKDTNGQYRDDMAIAVAIIGK